VKTGFTLLRLLLLLFIAAVAAYPQSQTSSEKDVFELGFEFTLERAEREYQELLEDIKRYSLKPEYKSCSQRRKDEECIYFNNFPLSVAEWELTKDCKTGALTSWVPPSKAAGGKAVVELLKRRAARREIFGCKGTRCKIVVTATSTDPHTTVLAGCDILKIGNTLGAPQKCEAIAIITADKILVKIIFGILKVACVNGTDDIISVNFMVVHPPRIRVSDMRNALQNTFSNPPLSYAVDASQETIVGTASYRVSPILSPYREMITAKIDMYEEGTGQIRYFCVRVSVELYVNRYNTTRRRDWRLPNDQQVKLYQQSIKTFIKSSLESICQTYDWQQNAILFCELPANTPIDSSLRFYLTDR
jgi:hypothetical protein